MSTFFIPNCDFDFRLNNEELSPKIQRAVEEMAALFLPMLESDDTVQSSFESPFDFREYLKKCQLSSATFKKVSQDGQDIDAWGWDVISAHNEAIHPSFETVAKVNSREFSFGLGQKLGVSLKGSCLLTPTNKSQLLPLEGSEGEWVLKPLFGNAGSGFIRGNGTVELSQTLERLSSSFLLEPWKERITDIASSLTIAQDGTITVQGHHRNISNRAGSFYANLLAPFDSLIQPYVQELTLVTTQIAQTLFQEGYFGAVGIDSFTYKEDGKEHICIGFDINARHAISSISYGVHSKVGTKQTLLYRFIARRRMVVPQSYSSLLEMLGDIAYDTNSKRGVILLTPLELISGKEKRIPARFAFGVVAATIEEVFELDEMLRERILKKK